MFAAANKHPAKLFSLNPHQISQIRRKYKISLGHKTATDFLSPIASSVKYSRLFDSFFGLVLNNVNNSQTSLAINLDNVPTNGPIALIVAKKQVKKEAKLVVVVEKKATIVAKKVEMAEARKIEAATKRTKAIVQKTQKALEKKIFKEEQTIKKVEEHIIKKVKISIEKSQIAKQKAVLLIKNNNAKKKNRQPTNTNIKKEKK